MFKNLFGQEISLRHEDKKDGAIVLLATLSMVALMALRIEYATPVVIFTLMIGAIVSFIKEESWQIIGLDILLIFFSVGFVLFGCKSEALSCLIVIVLLKIGMSLAKFRWMGEKAQTRLLVQTLEKSGLPLLPGHQKLDIKAIYALVEKLVRENEDKKKLSQ
jgi:hypothetical protein